MIPKDTPYKVIKYLMRLHSEKVMTANYANDKYLIHILDRGYVVRDEVRKNSFSKTAQFDDIYVKEISPLYARYDTFIKKHGISDVESYYTIGDFDALIAIDEEQPVSLTLQEILAKYFQSSKYTQADSNLSNAIKKILNKNEFAEDGKDQQYLSVLYPINRARFIILCENKNRLRGIRHEFIEFWFAGGRNTSQLAFIPKPPIPIYYLFDWDFDGLSIYTHIKRNHFPKLAAFIPLHYGSLMEKRDEVKHQKSTWKNSDFLQALDDQEKAMAKTLINNDMIIEEQKILLTRENLFSNGLF